MKERGMTFNTLMVRAILDDRKTQTRRPIKNQPCVNGDYWTMDGAGWGRGLMYVQEAPGVRSSLGLPNNCIHSKVGDRIWVRETWQAIHEELNADGYVDETTYAPSIPKEKDSYWSAVYAADGWCEDREQRGFPWRPAIHMPRWASRILLEITNIRVERLQSISDHDVLQEGFCQLPASGRYCLQPGLQHVGMANHSAQEAYSWLWESIYGKGSWQLNPWVWVIEFKRVEGGTA